MSLIQVLEASVAFLGHTVLDCVNLTVDSGRIVTVVGPNGAGKSTLLKVAVGLLTPDRGSVAFAAKTVGYVPQKLTVERILPLSVLRFLAMAVRGTVEHHQLEGALDLVGAGHVLGRQVADLSGGETQRVLLARALLRRPDLLVLDEPVGGVDMAGQAELYDLIATLAHRDGVGVLMVSHDLHVVMAATDEVVCLNRHVCCAGHPETVSRHPEYLALFGPRVANSLAIYTHAHDHYNLYYEKPDSVLRDFEKNQFELGIKNKLARLPGRNMWRLKDLVINDNVTGRQAADTLYKSGYRVFGWDLEWQHSGETGIPLQSVNEMIEIIQRKLREGKTIRRNQLVLLAHDEMFRNGWEESELKQLILKLKSFGNYRFEHLSNYPD